MPDQDNSTASVRAVLDSFRSVWERIEGTAVTPEKLDKDAKDLQTQVPPIPSFDSRLREQIDTADRAAIFDRELACRCSGPVRVLLRKHAALASKRAAVLRGELFVRTGERRHSPSSCPRLGDTLASLREGMLRDRDAAKALRDAAKQTEERSLCAILERFAVEAESAAAETKQYILRCFQ
jgi:hypothetical protein